MILNKFHIDGKLKREGSIESFDMLPLAGYESFGSASEEQQFLVQPIEVYSYSDYLVLIQIRSSCVQGRLPNFCKELQQFLEAECISKLVLLTGAQPNDLFEAIVKGNGLFHIGENHIPPAGGIINSQEIASEFTNQISGMPLARCIYDFNRKVEAEVGPEFKILIVGKLCAEGDNRKDGISLARAVSVGMGLIKEDYFSHNVQTPSSWNALAGKDLMAEQQRMGTAIYF